MLETVPGHINSEEIKTELESLEGVSEVHDIHIWSITTGTAVLTAHICVDVETMYEANAIVRKAARHLEGKNIAHVTLQLEDGTKECPTGICEHKH